MTAPYFAAPALAAEQFESLRRRLLLRHCKWDPQVSDVSVLSSFPLVLSRHRWRELSDLAERLTREALEAETEIAGSPHLHRVLAIPRPIRSVLARLPDEGPSPTAARILRFDFHWCSEGWRISEVNADVPGGLTESTSFPALMEAQYSTARSCGAVATVWADTLAQVAPGGTFALVSAPGYMEDQQILCYLAGLLHERGSLALLATPAQVRWSRGRAEIEHRGRPVVVDALVRFYQAEWLARLPTGLGWRCFFGGGATPVANAGTAILLESKRFPLVWDSLRAKLPTFRELLPETRDPRDVNWRDPEWVLKGAFGNTGDEVSIAPLQTAAVRRRVLRSVWLAPGTFVAQRRFDALPVASPIGAVYPCIGVYTVNGRTAGAYARISQRPFIDYLAQDAAVLVEKAD